LKTKEASAKKRAKRRQRGGKLLTAKELRESTAQRAVRSGIWTLRKKLWGNADRCENKGVAKKGIQMMLKTKE
jgi:hypothetical protein